MSSRRSTDRPGNARLLIVQTGSTFPQLRARRGDFADWFRVGMGLDRSQVEVVRADAGHVLPRTAGDHAGVIVTGSPSMVSERLAWSENTAAWLRSMVDQDVPILGVCYGHQLLAHALGGRVDFHPGGREIGTVRIERLAAAGEDALLGSSPDVFKAHASHQQSVLELPSDAVVLARSSHDPHHAVRYAPNVWGLQFHPEFSAGIMRDYLQRRRQAMNGDCPADCCAHRVGAPAPTARRLLRRFRDITRRASARSA
ncbi:MAG: glutamine amidotransferase [Dokdonella sp.]|uniref:glutamine amidotransferase n=1 Tax=Dokdonella sp. TaxID=2291710 RepID=UPI003262E532